jgi:uncharacterized protein (UPF0305 family)
VYDKPLPNVFYCLVVYDKPPPNVFYCLVVYDKPPPNVFYCPVKDHRSPELEDSMSRFIYRKNIKQLSFPGA